MVTGVQQFHHLQQILYVKAPLAACEIVLRGYCSATIIKSSPVIQNAF